MKCKARCSLQLSQLLDTTCYILKVIIAQIMTYYYMSVIVLHLSSRFKKHVSERNRTRFYSGLTLSNEHNISIYVSTLL